MKKVTLLILLVVTVIFNGWSQDCIPKGLKVERTDQNGKIKETLNYSFSYDDANNLKEVVVVNNNLDVSEEKHTISFKNIDLGKKITWYWNKDYSSHYIITPNNFMAFYSDSEDDLNLNNAEKYTIRINNSLLTKIAYNSDHIETFSYENDVVTLNETKNKNGTDATTFTYADASNPLVYLRDLAFIEISDANFIPLSVTLSNKLLLSEKRTTQKNGSEVIESKKYTHILNANGCPTEFVNQEALDKIVYTFKY